MSLLADFVAQLGAHGGVEAVALDESRCCTLLFDDLAVFLEEHDGGDAVFMYAHLGELPPGDEASICRRLLAGNFLTGETAGATLGVAPDSGIVALSLHWYLRGRGYADFEARLQSFVDGAFVWRGTLMSPGEPSTSGPRALVDRYA